MGSIYNDMMDCGNSNNDQHLADVTFTPEKIRSKLFDRPTAHTSFADMTKQ